MTIPAEEFPYINGLHINDAFVIQGVHVPVFEDTVFKHLVLTGKNGSGKTTILESIAAKIQFDVTSADKHLYQARNLRSWLEGDIDAAREKEYRRALKLLEAVEIHFSWPRGDWNLTQGEPGTFPLQKDIIVAYFPAARTARVNDVSAPAKEDAYVASLAKPAGEADFAKHFKQYMVNKKVAQALAQLDGKPEKASESARFFIELERTLRQLFGDQSLTIEFVSEEYEFYLARGDGRQITFNQLSAGFSASLGIIVDLLMRVDLLRKQLKDFSYHPRGFVLIDEPETHLHLEMQYELLPLLTRLFPNIQFIVATHSPAVASSIPHATVFDLVTREVLRDQAAGSSYSELMLTHFDVTSEYSAVAKAILSRINEIVRQSAVNPEESKRALRQLLDEQHAYISPGLYLEIEAQLAALS